MEIRSTLKAGQRGTRRLVNEYGRKLVCVRYRYDPKKGKRYKTVELIVEEKDWRPKHRPTAATRVGVRVAWGEAELARRVKAAGGRWNAEKRVWELPYGTALALGLADRIVNKPTG